MIASKVICDDTYSNQSWVIVAQNMFALQEINQMERELCAYLEWNLNVQGEEVVEFEARIRSEHGSKAIATSSPSPGPTSVLPVNAYSISTDSTGPLTLHVAAAADRALSNILSIPTPLLRTPSPPLCAHSPVAPLRHGRLIPRLIASVRRLQDPDGRHCDRVVVPVYEVIKSRARSTAGHDKTRPHSSDAHWSKTPIAIWGRWPVIDGLGAAFLIYCNLPRCRRPAFGDFSGDRWAGARWDAFVLTVDVIFKGFMESLKLFVMGSWPKVVSRLE
jgi:hypothetical protein